MKIGIVADTHSRPLPTQMLKAFKNVDLIIHAGDFCDEPDIKPFSKLAEVKAVYGNMDTAEIRALYPEKQIIECESIKIGLTHGHGNPQGIMDVIQKEFTGDEVDVVIFGHSHEAMNQTIGTKLFFNPGSPNDKIFAPYCSYGLMEVTGKKIDAKIVKLED